MLSAFVGSIINGLSSGFWVAFFTGWISWLSVIRILAAGLYEFYLTANAGANFIAADENQYQSIGLNMYGPARAAVGDTHPGVEGEEVRLTHEMNIAQQHLENNYHPAVAAQFEQQKNSGIGGGFLRAFFKQPTRTVTVTGWLGWIWSAVYEPISQSIWTRVHITSDDGTLLFVRALAIGVSALGLTFDYKQRYGAALARKWGSWAFVVFNVWNSTACLLLGCEALVLLIRGAMNLSHLPIPVYVAYPILSCIWAGASWKFLPPVDAGRPGINIVADVFMGAFAGIFVAAPAFALWQWHKFDAHRAEVFGENPDPGMSLGEFLSCDGASVLAKFAAIMP
jgi:hypothetical protein